MKKSKGVYVFMENLPLKPVELEINPSDPWSDDKLERKTCSERLTKILASQPGPLTVSLNGKWGTGKTFLLKRWRYDLLNAGYVSVYYNAWEDDSLRDPLVSILAQLWQDLGCNKNIKMDKEIIEKVQSILAAVIALSVKYATGSKADLAEIFKDIRDLKDLDNLQDGGFSARQLLTKYIEENKSKMTMRAKLNDLALSVYDNAGQKPLIFIVDELDRCRPTFAIETLERIKHLFSIDHVIFVLGIDREQLGHSIQSVYGNIDVENYLHRFIDLDLRVPDPDPLAFFDWLADNVIKNEYKKTFWHDFKSSLEELVLNQHFSLREIEHFFVVMRWMLNVNNGEFQSPILLAVLVVLKIGNPSMYDQYIKMTITPDKVIDYLIPGNAQMEPYRKIMLACTVYFSYLPQFPGKESADQKKIVQLLKDILNGKLPSNGNFCARCIVDALESGQFEQCKSFLDSRGFLLDLDIQRPFHIDMVKKLSERLEMDFLVKPQT